MKKIILPSTLIFMFIFIDSRFPNSKYILLRIYIFFPIMFIIEGIIYSNSIKSMLIGFLLSSLSIILPICKWYNIGSMILPVMIYLLLGIITFFLSKIISTIKIKS